MRRRTFIAASLPLVAATAGCVGGAGRPGASPRTGSDDPDSTPGTSATTEPPGSARPPAPATASDVFDEFGCPSFDDAADRTVCYHAVDPTRVDVVLGVDPEVFDPYLEDDTVETLTFTLYNRSDWYFRFNHYAWGIERFEDGEWVHVAPDAYPEPLMELAPGGTYAWELPSEPHPSPGADRSMRLDVALPAGVYAFHVAGSFGPGFDTTEPSTGAPQGDPPDERVECVGLFRLDADVDPESSGGTPRETATGTVDG